MLSCEIFITDIDGCDLAVLITQFITTHMISVDGIGILCKLRAPHGR